MHLPKGNVLITCNPILTEFHSFNTETFHIIRNFARVNSKDSMLKPCRWNVSASGARPNPQGSFRYGSINVTDVYVLKNKPLVTNNGKIRATLSGISFVNPATPIRLADQFKVKGVYKLDFPNKPLTGSSKMETSVINGTYRGFMEVILQNNDTKMQSYHLSGYAVFVVG
jgi:hypothetical protein